MLSLFSSFLPTIFLFIFQLFSEFTAGPIFAVDRCAIFMSGSTPRRTVRSVAFDCKEGSLSWKNIGLSGGCASLLVSFSFPFLRPPLTAQICLRFLAPFPKGTTVHQIVHSQLLPFLPSTSPLLDEELSLLPPLQCVPFQVAATGSSLQLFVRLCDDVPTRLTLSPSHRSFEFFYSVEERSVERERIPCGLCSLQQFMEAFCTSNFVFRGKFLRHSLSGHSLLFSAESPLIRRPVKLIHGTDGRLETAQFNSTVLYTSNCPRNALPPMSFHTKYIVTADAKIGFARLRCLMEHSAFVKISANSSLCDIGRRSKNLGEA